MFTYWEKDKIKSRLECAISDIEGVEDMLSSETPNNRMMRTQIGSMILNLYGIIHLVEEDEVEEED